MPLEDPLRDMAFLDGFMSVVYDNDDLPDGAWFSMCIEHIERRWPHVNGHEVFLEYAQWKEKRNENIKK